MRRLDLGETPHQVLDSTGVINVAIIMCSQQSQAAGVPFALSGLPRKSKRQGKRRTHRNVIHSELRVVLLPHLACYGNVCISYFTFSLLIRRERPPSPPSVTSGAQCQHCPKSWVNDCGELDPTPVPRTLGIKKAMLLERIMGKPRKVEAARRQNVSYLLVYGSAVIVVACVGPRPACHAVRIPATAQQDYAATWLVYAHGPRTLGHLWRAWPFV